MSLQKSLLNLIVIHSEPSLLIHRADVPTSTTVSALQTQSWCRRRLRGVAAGAHQRARLLSGMGSASSGEEQVDIDAELDRQDNVQSGDGMVDRSDSYTNRLRPVVTGSDDIEAQLGDSSSSASTGAVNSVNHSDIDSSDFNYLRLKSIAETAIRVMDLTSLDPEQNTEGTTRELCQKAVGSAGPYPFVPAGPDADSVFIPPTAAVCVLPDFVETAKQELIRLGNPTTKVATVVNFHRGDEPEAKILHDTRFSLEKGADEIDLVYPYGQLKEIVSNSLISSKGSYSSKAQGTKIWSSNLTKIDAITVEEQFKFAFEQGKLLVKNVRQEMDLFYEGRPSRSSSGVFGGPGSCGYLPQNSSSILVGPNTQYVVPGLNSSSSSSQTYQSQRRRPALKVILESSELEKLDARLTPELRTDLARAMLRVGFLSQGEFDSVLKSPLNYNSLSLASFVRAASTASIRGGCDFLKTSTGKTEDKRGASEEAVAIMTQEIFREEARERNQIPDSSESSSLNTNYYTFNKPPVGIKVSGGVATVDDAEKFFRVVRNEIERDSVLLSRQGPSYSTSTFNPSQRLSAALPSASALTAPVTVPRRSNFLQGTFASLLSRMQAMQASTRSGPPQEIPSWHSDPARFRFGASSLHANLVKVLVTGRSECGAVSGGY